MFTRRDLMKSAGLSAALGALPVSLAARMPERLRAGDSRRGRELRADLGGWIVLADPEFEDSLAFAADLRIRGAEVLECSGRVDALWYRTLRGICTAAVRPPVAGLLDRRQALELRLFGENVLYFAAQRDFAPLRAPGADSLESFVLAPIDSRGVARL